VGRRLRREGFRATEDLRNEKLGFKIREHQLQKVPYVLVTGDREMKRGGVSLRSREEGDLGYFAFEDVVRRLREESQVNIGLDMEKEVMR
jgi:threonyl-tRNA synthetase